MIYQAMILVLVPMLMTNCNHTSKIQSDVIVTYSNHAESEPKPNQVETKTERPMIERPEKPVKKRPEKPVKESPRSEEGERNSEEVIFVPNEREVVRNEDYLVNNPVGIEDFMARRTVDDVMGNGNVRVETEAPNDIIFFSGKNNENENTKEPKKETGDTRRGGTEIEKVDLKLNCSNLDCNSAVDSVCGGKVEHKQWRYRLFLNECFFRKVNCYFKHSINRYQQVPIDKCKNVGAHAAARPSSFQLFPPGPVFSQDHVRIKPVQVNYTRKSFSSRRSLTVSIDGKSCSHLCPASCPDDYEPECAVSGAGQRRVFVNHCKLDYNSCTFSIVWHKRPLSECVGGKKADMRQNRGFIDWMQRVGIVDNKGRLVLS